MLVVRGEPVFPEAHLSRLEASLGAVYEAELPEQTGQLIAERGEGLELGRLRLTFVPGEGLEAESGEIDRSLHFPDRPVSLRPHAVDGGLGCHKWADRAAIPASPPGEAALLVDGDEVLEAGRANVFAVRKGALFTPPLDGRILPGVTRATVIELARDQGIEVEERTLTLGDLRKSDEVFLTNSIRGIEVVASVAGAPVQPDGSMIHALSSALQRSWGLSRPEPAPAFAAVPPPRPRAR
jgi:para-aminobenzoate synthetase/4-amino-4-deoxychorismate lyase